MPREVQGATHRVHEVSRSIPERARLGFATELEALLLPQQVLELCSGSLRRPLYLPYDPQSGWAIELPCQGVRLNGFVMEQLGKRPSHVALGDTDGGGHLHENFGRDGVCLGDGAPALSTELGGSAEDYL